MGTQLLSAPVHGMEASHRRSHLHWEVLVAHTLGLAHVKPELQRA